MYCLEVRLYEGEAPDWIQVQRFPSEMNWNITQLAAGSIWHTGGEWQPRLACSGSVVLP